LTIVFKIRSWLAGEIIKKAAKAVIFRALGAVIGFILTLLITREFGAEISGNYFFVVSLLVFIFPICSLGLSNAIVKEIAIQKGDDFFVSEYFTKSLAMSLLSIAVVIAIINFYVFTPASIIGVKHMIIVKNYMFIQIGIMCFSLMLLFSAYFQAISKINWSLLLLNTGYQFLMIGLILFFPVKSLNALLSILLVAMLCMVAISLFIYLRIDRYLFKWGAKVSMGRIFKLSLPMMFTQVISQVGVFGAHFLLSIYGDAADIAVYSVCLRIAIIITFLSMVVNRIVAPKFARLYSEGRMSELIHLASSASKILIVFSLGFLSLLFIFGREILELFGSEFISGYKSLLIIAVGQAVASVCGLAIYLLQMTGFHKDVLKGVACSAGLSIIAGMYLIPHYGVLGAAIMAFIMLVVTNIYALFIVKRKLNFKSHCESPVNH